MKNEQLNPDSKLQQKDSQTNLRAAAIPSINYPNAARVTAQSGSNGLYSISIEPVSSQGTSGGDFWEQNAADGGYSAYPVVNVEFTTPLPNGSSWTLRNSTGIAVASGHIKNASVQNLSIRLEPLPNGQPSLTGLETFTLQFTNLVPNVFANLVIGSTGGGLVIIANVDGCEYFYDPIARAHNTATELSHFAIGDNPL